MSSNPRDLVEVVRIENENWIQGRWNAHNRFSSRSREELRHGEWRERAWVAGKTPVGKFPEPLKASKWVKNALGVKFF